MLFQVSYLLCLWLFLTVEAHYNGHKETVQEINRRSSQDDPPTRQKRLFTKVESDKWPKAIVPYVITEAAMPNKIEYEKIMSLYEDQSCVRFPYWNSTTTSQKYGLGHQGHMKFIKSGGCYANSKGISKSKGGIGISCCANGHCIHEIGHVLGFTHEQVSPLRDGWIRINWNNIWPSRRGSFTKSFWSHLDLSKPYDISTIMHYTPGMYSAGGPSSTVLFPELEIKWDTYYFYMEIADGYKCYKHSPCNGRILKCENDGYQTILSGKCTCKCPTGLDPDNLCKTPLKKVSSSWPKGEYGLPEPKTGCPDDGHFESSGKIHYGPGGNSMSDPYRMKGEVRGTRAEINGCLRTPKDYIFDSEEAEKFNWPLGQYCFYKTDSKCPSQFSSGSIKNGNATQSFCCKYRGYTKMPASFPAEKPFALIRSSKLCQQVTGMRSEEEEFTIKSATKFNIDAMFKKWLSKDELSLTVPLCYYKPVDMGCGGAITLTKEHPETTIQMSGSGRNDLECTWIIRGDHDKGTLVLDFEEFSMKMDGKSCSDKVEIRHSRIGQNGLEYCGDDVSHSIRSITNKLLLRFFTTGNSDSSFKARIKWTPDSDLCYDVGLRGVSYNGNVNYTRTFEPCLPWVQVADECQHHPFLKEDFLDNLEGNACRNPDNSFRPWCYTNIDGCKRNYCDVCGVEVPHDHLDYCPKLKKAGFCSRDGAMAVKYCASTCYDQLPNKSAVKKYSNIECNTPTAPRDGEIVGKTKHKYNLGETVEFKCNRGISVVSSRCMTSGKWSHVGYACIECPLGFTMFNNTCYKLMDDGKDVSYNTAMDLCTKMTGTIPAPRTKKEAQIIVIAAGGKNIWIAINDKKTEGTWVYDKDGSKLQLVNWDKYEPNNRGGREDCAVMKYTQKWMDVPCSSSYSVVCAVPKLENLPCEDFIGGNTCQSLLTDRPTMCKEYPDFANENCRKSCGVCLAQGVRCPVGNTKSNVLTISTSKSTISVGETVTYGCEKFTYRHTGNEVRACLPDTTLSGEPLHCGDCPIGYAMVNKACHGLIEEKMLTWTDAKKECQKLGGFVAMPKSQAENDEISKVGLGEQLWIGATDADEENDFIWEDNSKVTWKNWAVGDPKNNDGRDCTVMNEKKRWVNVDCDDLKLTTVCTIPKSGGNVCYDVRDKGVTYNGKVNVTDDNEPCGNWADKSKCNVNPFKKGLERYNMEENYCRNADNSDGPWCYTKGCSWALCDVCDNDKHVDKDDTTKNYADIQCSFPTIPSDGEIAGVKRSSYKLGDVVTFKCKTNKFEASTTCLTSGDWSPIGLVCTECPLGYFLYKNTCYSFVDKKLTHDKGQEECKKVGGHLPRPKSMEENKFVAALSRGHYYWMDAKRTEGKLEWSDGSAIGWTNWQDKKPGGYICGFSTTKGDWGMTKCDFLHANMRLICAVPKEAIPTCEDFLDTQCPQLLADKTTMCQEFPEFSRNYCAKTCGVCGNGDVKCNIQPDDLDVTVTSTTNATISVGSAVEFDCDKGRYYSHGDKHRACLPNGQLTGTPVKCNNCPVGYTEHDNACYSLLDKMYSYSDAVKECKKLNGYIASPKSTAENDFVDSVRGTNNIWIGASDELVEGDFLWQDGTRVKWANWNKGEPNNYGGYQDCVEMITNKEWEDVICDGRKNSLVCTVPIVGKETCYDPRNKGVNYNGNANTTISLDACITWAMATKCQHNPFKEGNERTNLEENFCRNPDETSGPWCYTDADTCNKQYCGVCNEDGSKDFTEIRCKQPPTPPADGVLVGELKSEYKLGEVVHIGCKTTKFTVTSTCMTNGDWSPVGLACTECPLGYQLYKGSCYGNQNKKLNFQEAQKVCRGLGGYIASPKNAEENEFIFTLRNGHDIWIGANDVKKEGTYEWGDGTKVTWNNWQPGEPNDWGYGEDAVVIRSNKKWNDIYSWSKASVVCSLPKSEDLICKDFLKVQCLHLLEDNPAMCKDFGQFAAQFCAETCGVCGTKGISCDIPSNSSFVTVSTTTSSTIGVGNVVSYRCINDNFFPFKGDKLRACQSNGALTGMPLECKEVLKANMVMVGSPTLTKGKTETPELRAFFGDNPLWRIQNNGQIVAWEYYSLSSVQTSFQVWRKVRKDSYELIGQNVVTTGDTKDQRYDVPTGQKIKVKRGDLIGIVNAGKGGVRFSLCDDKTHPDWAVNFSWSSKASSLADFVVGKVWPLTSSTSCCQFFFRAIVALTE